MFMKKKGIEYRFIIISCIMLYHIFYRDVWCVSTHHNKSQLQSLSEPGIMFPSLLEITNWYTKSTDQKGALPTQ